MIDIARSERVRELLVALSEQLAARGQHYELVVVGGSALLALELVLTQRNRVRAVVVSVERWSQLERELAERD